MSRVATYVQKVCTHDRVSNFIVVIAQFPIVITVYTYVFDVSCFQQLYNNFIINIIKKYFFVQYTKIKNNFWYITTMCK